MQITEEHLDDATVLVLNGRLTVSDAPGQLKAAATRAAAGPVSLVLIDLAGVPYIDSTRLGELITSHISVARLGKRLALLRPTARILELLSLAGLAGVFATYDSVDDARRG